jgi:hypothetical protein
VLGIIFFCFYIYIYIHQSALAFEQAIVDENLALLTSESARDLPIPDSSRYRFVELFRLLSHENPAKTIEFRQHDGSMDAEEISKWVLFVTRLVRAAECLAAESKPASPVSPSFMRRWETLWSAKHLGENVAENNTTLLLNRCTSNQSSESPPVLSSLALSSCRYWEMKLDVFLNIGRMSPLHWFCGATHVSALLANRRNFTDVWQIGPSKQQALDHKLVIRYRVRRWL